MATAPARSLPERGFWEAVDGLIDSSPGLADLTAHRLHLLAGRRWRERGMTIPDELRSEEHSSALISLGVPSVLARIRAACDGPLVLFKGYELALRYPDPALRPYSDIDLLVEDPVATSSALRAAGFEPAGYEDVNYDELHHVRPLLLPELPLLVELHRRLQWVGWVPAPPSRTLIESAVPSRSGIAGVSTLAPAHHALAMAAQSWAGLPFRRILDLVDTALLAEEAGPEEVERWARLWRLEGLWALTSRAQEALFEGRPAPRPVRTLAPALLAVRDASVLEQHKRRLLGPFAVLPLRAAIPQAMVALGQELIPQGSESWSSKLRRTLRALRHPRTPLAEHRQAIGQAPRKPE